MRLSGALTLIGAATVGMVGTAGEETSRELWRDKRGQNGHGTHGHGHHHDDGPRGKVYRRVMVKEGHPETVRQTCPRVVASLSSEQTTQPRKGHLVLLRSYTCYMGGLIFRLVSCE